MKTVGKIIKDARLKKRFSKEEVENQTKIKKQFIDCIEKEKWDELPDYPTVQGFVRSIARTLDLKEDKVMAFLRRDYPPKDISINPKPDIGDKFVWSPKTTFFFGISIITLIVLGYLGIQYKKFISPPKLELIKPVENQIVENMSLEISGQTTPDAIILANNQPILVDTDGNFFAELAISGTTEEIEVKAISRSGKETTIHRKIQLQLEE